MSSLIELFYKRLDAKSHLNLNRLSDEEVLQCTNKCNCRATLTCICRRIKTISLISSQYDREIRLSFLRRFTYNKTHSTQDKFGGAAFNCDRETAHQERLMSLGLNAHRQIRRSFEFISAK